MDEKTFQEKILGKLDILSEKLSVLIALLARKDEKVAKNANTALDFFENYETAVSNRDIANILGIVTKAVSNAKAKRKKKSHVKASDS